MSHSMAVMASFYLARLDLVKVLHNVENAVCNIIFIEISSLCEGSAKDGGQSTGCCLTT